MGTVPIKLLLPAEGSPSRRHSADESDRRAIYQDAFLRKSEDGRVFESSRPPGESETGSEIDARDGDSRDLSRTQYQPTPHGACDIFNTDQGCQFTSADFTNRLQERKIQISMDSRGRAFDNIFNERLWRSVEYEDVYPQGYPTMIEAQTGLSHYFRFYNHERFHQALDYRTPREVHGIEKREGRLSTYSQ